MTSTTFATLMLTIALILFALTAPTLAARKSSSLFVPGSRHNDYRRLHELLSIGDNPNEDIRTNILLNMEGI